MRYILLLFIFNNKEIEAQRASVTCHTANKRQKPNLKVVGLQIFEERGHVPAHPSLLCLQVKLVQTRMIVQQPGNGFYTERFTLNIFVFHHLVLPEVIFNQ